MRPTLYIYLRDVEDDASTAYRIDGAATGSVQHSALATIAEQAAGTRVVVIVPANAIHFLDVELPVRSRTRALAAAPFACEERLAEDVERLHFAHVGRPAETRHSFAVLSHQRMRAWLDRLTDAGLTPDAMIPDVMCLPAPNEGEWTVLAEPQSDRVLLRTGAYTGLVATPDSLGTIIALSADATPMRLRALQLEGSPEITLDGETVPSLQTQPEFGDCLDVLIRHIPDQDACNLLQGAHAPQSQIARYALPWRRPLAVAALILLLVLGLRVAETIQLNRMAENQKADNLVRFSQEFAGYSNPRHEQLARFLGAEARAAEGGGAEDSMLRLLASYARAANEIDGLNLRGMQWRDAALTLNIRGESLETLEALRDWYSNESAVAMSVQNADAGSEGVRIRIRLSRSVDS